MAQRPLARRFQTNTKVTPVNPQVTQVPGYNAVEPPTPDTTGSKLAQALQIGSMTVTGAAQFISDKSQKDLQEGQQMALAGDKPQFDLDLFNQKMKGYYTTQALVDVNRGYKADVNKFLLTEAPTLNIEEFEARLNEIGQQYLVEQPEPYVDAFIKNAVNIEDQAYSSYQSMLGQQLQQKNLNLMNQYVATTVEDTLLKVAGDNLDGSFASMQDLGENKAALDAFGYLKNDKIVEALRVSISDAQDKGSELGLTKDQVSELAIDSIGNIAVTYGLPELLDVGDIKDQDGVKLKYTKVGNKIQQYRARAIETKNQIADLTEQQSEAQRKATVEVFTKQQYVRLNDLYSIADPVQRATEAQKILNDLKQSDSFYMMDTSDINSITKSLNKEIEGGSSYGESDVVTYAQLKANIRAGNSSITYSSLVDAMNSGQINQQDFRELYDLKTQVDQQASTKNMTTQQQQVRSAVSDARDSVINFLSTQLTGVGALEAKDKAAIEMELLEREDDFYKNYGYTGFKYSDYLNEVVDPVLAAHGLSRQDILSYQNEYSDVGDRGFGQYVSGINTSYMTQEEAAQVYQQLGLWKKMFNGKSREEAIMDIQKSGNAGKTSFSESQAIDEYNRRMSRLPLIESEGNTYVAPIDKPDIIASNLAYDSFDNYKQITKTKGDIQATINLARDYYKKNGADLASIKEQLISAGHSPSDVNDYTLLFGVNKAVNALKFDNSLDNKVKIYIDLRALGFTEDVATKIIGIGLKSLQDPQGQFAQMFK